MEKKEEERERPKDREREAPRNAPREQPREREQARAPLRSEYTHPCGSSPPPLNHSWDLMTQSGHAFKETLETRRVIVLLCSSAEWEEKLCLRPR